MGCHTFIYKKVTDKVDLMKLLYGAIIAAERMIDSYNSYEPGQYEEEMDDVKQQMDQYWRDVKNGMIIHNPDFICHYFIDGRWIVCDEMTFEDVINGYNDVIKACKHALLTYDSFDELKRFIIDHNRYYGFFFESPHSEQYWNDTTFIDDEQLINMTISNGDIYVRSNKIQKEAFEHTPFFRVEGYPCWRDKDFYKGSPTEESVFGWDNADDLIAFLEWYKTTDTGKKHKPSVEADKVDYGDKLYDVIRSFFTVNEGKNLLVHFG